MISDFLRHVHGNIICGHGDDRRALYRLDVVSYPGLSAADKQDWWSRLCMLAFVLQADFDVLRYHRTFEGTYQDQAAVVFDDRHGHPELFRERLDDQAAQLAGRAEFTPEIYLAVAISGHGARALRAGFARDADRARQRLEGAFRVRRNRALPATEITELADIEEKVHQLVTATVPGRRVTTAELTWCYERHHCAGLAEPEADPHWEPNALLIKRPDGREEYRPLESSMRRLVGPTAEEHDGLVRVRTEHGESWQAIVALGALPKTSYLGRNAERLFTPFETLDYPVDSVMHVQWESNDQAIARVARKVLDADNEFSEEEDSSTGSLSWAAERKRVRARALREYYESEDQPPQLKISVLHRVAGDSPAAVREKLAQVRRKLGTVKLHLPVDELEDYYYDFMPRPDGARVWTYADFMTVEQFAGFMAIAAHWAGAPAGVHVGRIITGGSRSLLDNPGYAAGENMSPSWLISGVQGSGKTTFAELIAIHTALAGGLVIDIDPKMDHNLQGIPELQKIGVDELELSGHGDSRGRLDPFVIVPPDMRVEVAYSYFWGLLPGHAPPEWATSVRRAVQTVHLDPDRAPCGDRVVELLVKSDDANARAAGDALGVWGQSGLAALGFSNGVVDTKARAPVTTIRPIGLALPPEGVQVIDEHQRTSILVLKLLSAYAMALIRHDRSRVKDIIFDEAWQLLESPDAGRPWLAALNRMARYWNARAMFLTQLVISGDINDLIGARAQFGVKTDAEARRALEQLGQDPEDRRRRDELRRMRKGLGYIRDADDRVAKVQVELLNTEWLKILDTNPNAARARQVA